VRPSTRFFEIKRPQRKALPLWPFALPDPLFVSTAISSFIDDHHIKVQKATAIIKENVTKTNPSTRIDEDKMGITKKKLPYREKNPASIL